MGGTLPDDCGGSAGLLELLEEHGEAIEADLQRFYGLPLASLITGRGPTFDWRRLGVLVRQLPPEAAVYRSVHGDRAAWSTEAYLLALIVDTLSAANWQRGYNPKQPQPRPKPLPRPGDVPDGYRPKGRSLAEMDRLLADWNSGRLARTHRPKGERRVM